MATAASLSPENVADWLSTMAQAVPMQTIAALKGVVIERRIDGVKFSEIVNGCRVQELGCDNVSGLQVARMRKAWQGDHPDSVGIQRKAAPPVEEPPAMQSPQMSRRGGPPSPQDGGDVRGGGGGDFRGGGPPQRGMQDSRDFSGGSPGDYGGRDFGGGRPPNDFGGPMQDSRDFSGGRPPNNFGGPPRGMQDSRDFGSPNDYGGSRDYGGPSRGMQDSRDFGGGGMQRGMQDPRDFGGGGGGGPPRGTQVVRSDDGPNVRVEIHHHGLDGQQRPMQDPRDYGSPQDRDFGGPPRDLHDPRDFGRNQDPRDFGFSRPLQDPRDFGGPSRMNAPPRYEGGRSPWPEYGQGPGMSSPGGGGPPPRSRTPPASWPSQGQDDPEESWAKQRRKSSNSERQVVSTALVGIVIDRLAKWAGFDRLVALAELRDVLSPPIIDELRIVFGAPPMRRKKPQQMSDEFDQGPPPQGPTTPPSSRPPARQARQQQQAWGSDGDVSPRGQDDAPSYGTHRAAAQWNDGPDDRGAPPIDDPPPRQQEKAAPEELPPWEQPLRGQRPDQMAEVEAGEFDLPPQRPARQPPRQQEVRESGNRAVAFEVSRDAPPNSSMDFAPPEREQRAPKATSASAVRAPSGADDVDKSVAEVAAWIRALPATMVPDVQRENLARAVEAEGVCGGEFSGIAGTPAELAKRGVPSPAHGLKIRRAWEQVLRESECKKVAMEAQGQGKTPKAVKMVL